MRPPEDLELHELWVPASDIEQLVPDSARLVPGPPDVVATHRLRGGLLGHGLALLVALQRDLDASGGQLCALALRQDGVGFESRYRLSWGFELDTPNGLSDLVRPALQGVHLELLTPLAPSAGFA